MSVAYIRAVSKRLRREKCNKLWRKLWKDSAAILRRLVSVAVNSGITVQGSELLFMHMA